MIRSNTSLNERVTEGREQSRESCTASGRTGDWKWRQWASSKKLTICFVTSDVLVVKAGRRRASDVVQLNLLVVHGHDVGAVTTSGLRGVSERWIAQTSQLSVDGRYCCREYVQMVTTKRKVNKKATNRETQTANGLPDFAV